MKTLLISAAAAASLGALSGPLSADEVVPSNLIVQSALCVGSSCIDGEEFNQDILRLKADQFRMHFQDTSTSSGLPSNDWRILINDTFNGGRDYFAIEDADTGNDVFLIEAGARPSAIYMDDAGDLGLGTSAPEADLHVVDGFGPKIRLEQDTSMGKPAAEWDIRTTHATFVVGDDSSNIFELHKPDGSAVSYLYFGPDGKLGLNTDFPRATLHVRTLNGTGKILVSPGGSTQEARELFRMENNGGSYFTLKNFATNGEWYFLHENAAPNRFIITNNVNPSKGLFYTNTGNLQIGGVLTENSDKTTKMAIEPVDPAEVLAKVAALELSEWSYTVDDSGARHLGPMAQDFHALFGLGASETGISTLDTSGVALAAIQALQAENAELRARIERLEAIPGKVEAGFPPGIAQTKEAD